MLQSVRKRKFIVLFLIILTLCANLTLWQASYYQPVTHYAALGSYFDFLITLPVLVFILFRKKAGIKYLLLFIVLGSLIGSAIIPHEYIQHVHYINLPLACAEAAFICIEFYFLARFVFKAPQIRGEWKERKKREPYFLPAVRALFHKISPHGSLAPAISFELSVWHYALFTWKKREPQGDHLFTFHKKTSYITLNIMAIHAIILESAGFHFLLHEWKPWLAMIVLVLNLYTALLLAADIQAVRHCPIRIQNQKVTFQIGIFRFLEIPLSSIQSFEPFKPEDLKNKREKKRIFEAKGRDFIPEDPQFEIKLDGLYPSFTAFGITREVNRIHIRVDEPGEFSRMLAGCMEGMKSGDISTV